MDRSIAPPASSPPLIVGPCRDGDTTRQRHGAPCLCCHTDDFGAAGSLDPGASPAVRVVVTDARGDVASMSPNLFGNFFRHFPMTPPFRAKLVGLDGREQVMLADAPSADCNTCHWAGGSALPLRSP